MQQLADIEKTESTDRVSRPNGTKKNSRRKILVIFTTDSDKMNIAVYRFRNELYLKDKSVFLKMT